MSGYDSESLYFSNIHGHSTRNSVSLIHSFCLSLSLQSLPLTTREKGWGLQLLN